MNSLKTTGAGTALSPLPQQHNRAASDIAHPVQTLMQFLDEFHPQNVRDEIRQLCEVAVTTDNSTYDTGHKRSNLLTFSQKLDEMIAACDTIVQRHDAFKKYDHPPDAYEEPDYDYKADDPQEPVMPIERPELFSEALPDNPEYVLQEVFTSMHLYDFREDALPKWLKAALTNGNSCYSESEERTALLQLYDALLLLIEAMHLINEENKQKPGSGRNATHPEVAEHNVPVLLEEAEIKHPLTVVRRFCRQFPLVYVRRELHCFVHAAVAMENNYPKDFSPSAALQLYEEVLALVEVAYVLCEEDKEN